MPGWLQHDRDWSHAPAPRLCSLRLQGGRDPRLHRHPSRRSRRRRRRWRRGWRRRWRRRCGLPDVLLHPACPDAVQCSCVPAASDQPRGSPARGSDSDVEVGGSEAVAWDAGGSDTNGAADDSTASDAGARRPADDGAVRNAPRRAGSPPCWWCRRASRSQGICGRCAARFRRRAGRPPRSWWRGRRAGSRGTGRCAAGSHGRHGLRALPPARDAP